MYQEASQQYISLQGQPLRSDHPPLYRPVYRASIPHPFPARMACMEVHLTTGDTMTTTEKGEGLYSLKKANPQSLVTTVCRGVDLLVLAGR